MILITKRLSFTLIELMVVIVIISIIMISAYIKVNSLTRNTKENDLKYNMYILRSTLNNYYVEYGTYPADPISYAKSALGINFSIKSIFHSEVSEFIIVNSTNDITDSGKIAYIFNSTSPYNGYIFLDCSHQDLKGQYYYTY